MRAILISIRPEYVQAILQGRKSFELRRKFAKEVAIGSQILIYCTAPVSSLVATAKVSKVLAVAPSTIWKKYRNSIGVEKKFFDEYFKGTSRGFAIGLASVEELQRKVSYTELAEIFGIRPPQSFMYIDVPKSQRLTGRHEEDTSGHQYSSAVGRQQAGSRKLFATAADTY